jgi:glycosyltransferase involved in cell wall biosynthesis
LRIAVLRPQVPYVRGGVEIFTDELVGQLRARGHDAEVVTVPWQGWPNDRLLTNAFAWRTLDLASACDPPPELVIATKFPSYMISHSNKVTWLVHQYRQAYELHGTSFGQLTDSATDRDIRRRIQLMDRVALGESRRLFATSANVARRLADSTGLAAEVLHHPPQDLGFHCEAFEPFVLSVGRLEAIKRVELLIEAAIAEPMLDVVIAGEGPDRERLESMSSELPDGRVRFVGHVSESELADLYARCRAVFYAPLDEDFGMVPFEAFASGKPVVTTTDAGGPLEAVRDGENGIVVEATAEALARAFRSLLDNEQHARELGRNGLAGSALITWDTAIERLLDRPSAQ